MLTGDARPRFFESRSGGDAREAMTVGCKPTITHAARAAAKQLNLFRHLWWPRAARAKGSGQSKRQRAGGRAWWLSTVLSGSLKFVYLYLLLLNQCSPWQLA